MSTITLKHGDVKKADAKTNETCSRTNDELLLIRRMGRAKGHGVLVFNLREALMAIGPSFHTETGFTLLLHLSVYITSRNARMHAPKSKTRHFET